MTQYKRKTILSIQRCILGYVNHSVKVTHIGDGYNIRVFVNDILNQECRVYNKEDIRKEIAHMLRTEDKCGNISKMASSSRERYFRK